MAGGDENKAMEGYLDHLEALPFVRRAKVNEQRAIGDFAGKVLSLRTLEATVSAPLFVAKTNLTAPLVSHLVHASSSRKEPVFFFAPRISPRWGAELEGAGVNYVDAAGNCHVALDKHYVAHIEGKKVPVKPVAEKGMRAKGLLALFALLTDQRLVDSPVRSIAAAADGVSPQTASDVRNRLVHEEWVERSGRHHRWTPHGRKRALDLLLVHYEQLAAHLLLGRFKPRPLPLPELETALDQALRGHTFAWGGGAALQRRSNYYRGTRTLLYVQDTAPLSQVKGLLVPHAQGEVIFSRFPGPCALDDHGQLSPVLIYLDLMVEGQPRAREAAAHLRESLFNEDEA